MLIITETNQNPAERQKDYEVKIMMKYELIAQFLYENCGRKSYYEEKDQIVK